MLVKDPPAQIADRLWMLGAREFPLYFYRGRRKGTIFEGGISAVGGVLAEQLRNLDVADDFVTHLIITHAHPDHVMAAPVFRAMFPNLSVAASEPAAKTLSIEKAVAFFRKMDKAFTQTLVRGGSIAEGGDPTSAQEGAIAVDRVLREGDKIDVDDGVAFHVLETPGHSEGSLSFHEPAGDALIISDATGYYLPDQDWIWPNYFSGYEPYVRSIERLAGVGAETLCLSHNAVIQGADDVAAYFRRALDVTRDYHDRIVAEAKAGKSPEEIAAPLGDDVFQRTGQMSVEFFQKNCALLVQNSLQQEGLGAKR